jgi:hypothetical protein
MAIVVRFSPTGLTAAKYDDTMQTLEAAGLLPPDGLDHHICFGSDGDLRVSEIWDSVEQFEAFGADLLPMLDAAGIVMTAPPEVFQIHNTIRR